MPLDIAKGLRHPDAMWITYIANGIAAIAAGIAFMAIVLWEKNESEDRPNIGFWIGVLTVAAVLVVDFPLKPGEIMRSLGYAYGFALAVTFLGFGLLSLMSEEEE